MVMSPRAQKLAPQNPADALTGRHGNFVSLDMSDWICPDGTCPSRIGNRWVYMDDNHVTRTYMETLAPILKREIAGALGWEESSPAPQ